MRRLRVCLRWCIIGGVPLSVTLALFEPLRHMKPNRQLLVVATVATASLCCGLGCRGNLDQQQPSSPPVAGSGTSAVSQRCQTIEKSFFLSRNSLPLRRLSAASHVNVPSWRRSGLSARSAQHRSLTHSTWTAWPPPAAGKVGLLAAPTRRPRQVSGRLCFFC